MLNKKFILVIFLVVINTCNKIYKKTYNIMNLTNMLKFAKIIFIDGTLF